MSELEALRLTIKNLIAENENLKQQVKEAVEILTPLLNEIEVNAEIIES